MMNLIDILISRGFQDILVLHSLSYFIYKIRLKVKLKIYIINEFSGVFKRSNVF
jgi:hypothetical protein